MFIKFLKILADALAESHNSTPAHLTAAPTAAHRAAVGDSTVAVTNPLTWNTYKPC